MRIDSVQRGQASPPIVDIAGVTSDSLVDELEQLIRHAKPVPLTDQVRVDAKRIQEILAQLRVALTAERKELADERRWSSYRAAP